MFIRSSLNPIILPNEKMSWQSRKVYNPAVCFEDGKYHLFFRAVGEDWVSSIGYAGSTDGENFIAENASRLAPAGAREAKGIEDPRIAKIDSTYYLTYTAYDGDCARLSLATSDDLLTWQKHGTMLNNWDFYSAGGFIVAWDEARRDLKHNKGGWSKAGGIFCEKINHKFWMLFGDSAIWLASSTDGANWQAETSPFIEKRNGFFDSEHLEMGSPPIKTRDGWLVLYHGIDNQIVYRLGYLLLDLDNPKKILKRSQRPVFEPQTAYELAGLVDILPGGMEKMRTLSQTELDKFIKMSEYNKVRPRVVFCCGAALVQDTLRIYYGAGDTYVCTASAKLADVLAAG